MAREIKFRQPIFTNGVFEGFHYWGFIETGFHGPITNSDTSIKQAKEQSQQFTGLKDKHGKEIFEGDIVSMYDRPGNIWASALVTVFSESRAAFEFEDTFPVNEGEHIADISYISMELQEGWYMEIIGNVFEHPHLLAAGDRG
jgi:uncharacterized phage protein (TIGR01671 family)